MGLRVPLLGVDEVREFGRIADEEDGGVVEYPVEVTFICGEVSMIGRGGGRW
jgi:hypothetical protein